MATRDADQESRNNELDVTDASSQESTKEAFTHSDKRHLHKKA